MGEPRRETETIQPAFVQPPQHPNFPEVSGTSLPMLSTVLAGFAVTITVQLMIRPDAPDDLPGRIVIAIIVFLASTLFFLSSIIFAINAQANNYLPFLDLSDAAWRRLDVDDPSAWLRRIERRWVALHYAAIWAFYGGALLLLAGVNLVVWIFVETWVALLLLATILATVALIFAVSHYSGREHVRTDGGDSLQHIGDTE